MRFSWLLACSLLLHIIIGLLLPLDTEEADQPVPIEVDYFRHTPESPVVEPHVLEPVAPPALVSLPVESVESADPEPLPERDQPEESAAEEPPAEAPTVSLPRRSITMDDLMAEQSSADESLPFDPYRLSEADLRQLDDLFGHEQDPATESEDVITFEDGFYRLEYASFLWQLKRKIENVWIYPRAAIQEGEQGIVLLRFHIRKNGELDGVELVRNPSQSVYLANAALRAVRDAAPYAPLPDPLERLTINGVFIYSLGGQFIYSR